MRCQTCNTEANVDALFCPKCGAKLSSRDPIPGTLAPDSTGTDAAGSVKDAAPLVPNPTAGMGRRRVLDVPEETLWEGNYSPKAMLGPVVGCFLLSVLVEIAAAAYLPENMAFWCLPALGVMWLALASVFVVRRLGVHYKLTNQMFYHQKGVLTRTTDRIEAIDIDDVTWRQGLIERMVNVGTVEILSRDRSTPTFWVRGIENVEQVAQMIDKARRAERLRRGFLSIQEQSINPGA